MTIPEINTVCFVGAGTMGCYNAMAAAISGYRAVLYDVSAQSLARVEQTLQDMGAFLAGGGYCLAEDIPGALARITVSDNLEAAPANADLVSESVFERLDIKREIHAQLDSVCPTHTILTTNSSALLVSDIEDVVSRGDKFAALHTHLGSPLVDIVPGPRTSRPVLETLERYVASTGGVSLLLNKENPGYVLNAMLGPLLGTALALVLREGASVEAVDAAWMVGQQAPMGPFGMMDLFGVNLIRDTWQYRDRSDVLQPMKAQVLELLDPMVERGELGMKAGAGFYRYPEPAYQQTGFTSASHDQKLHEALLVALIGNAVILAADEIVEMGDIDRAWTIGTYLAQGPFELLRTTGVEPFQIMMREAVQSQRLDLARATKISQWLAQRFT